MLKSCAFRLHNQKDENKQNRKSLKTLLKFSCKQAKTLRKCFKTLLLLIRLPTQVRMKTTA